MFILGIIFAAVWLLGLVLVCIPCFALAALLMALSNLFLAGAYQIRDWLETLGNKIEEAFK